MKKINDQMQDGIYCFEFSVISSVVMHISKASATFKLAQTNEAQGDIDATKLVDEVKHEMKHLNFIKTEEVLKSCCPTLRMQ